METNPGSPHRLEGGGERMEICRNCGKEADCDIDRYCDDCAYEVQLQWMEERE